MEAISALISKTKTEMDRQSPAKGGPGRQPGK